MSRFFVVSALYLRNRAAGSSARRHMTSPVCGVRTAAQNIAALRSARCAAAIRRCEVLVLLFYGLYSDSGTAWECGYGYALGKRIVALHLHEGKSNCMINCSCRANVRGLDGLRAYDFCALPPINYYG